MDKPKTDPPHWAEKPFQRQLFYTKTSQAHRIEHQYNKEQNYNEEKRPVSWWLPFNDDEPNIPNNIYSSGSVDDGYESFDSTHTGVSTMERTLQEIDTLVNISEDERLSSRSRVSFSSLDDVKVFYPDLPEIRRPSGNFKPKKLTIEDNILRIGDTAMYRGRLGKRVDVLSRITDVSSRSSIVSPVSAPNSPNEIQSANRNVDDRDILMHQSTNTITDPLPTLRRVPRQLRQLSDGTNRQKTTRIYNAAPGPASCGVDLQRERIEQLLSTKPRRNSLKETTYGILPNISTDKRKPKTSKSNVQKPVRGTKLPVIGQSNADARDQETTACGQGEHSQRLSLPYLPKPPSCPRKNRGNSRHK